jgi:hypothetical protein
MKKEEYIKKKVILRGYGRLSELALNEEWFAAADATHGGIANVLEIKRSMGGIGGFFGSGKVEGVVIIFKDGVITCAESDGEYIDVFITE